MNPHSGQCMRRTAVAPSPLLALGGSLGHGLAREYVRELLDVGAADHGLALLTFAAQAVDELGPEDVDLAVQYPALVGDLLLLLREVVDERLQLLVGEGAEVRECVHGHPW